MLLGNVMFSRTLHPQNAEFPMLVIPSGMVMFGNFKHRANMDDGMLARLFEIVALMRFSQLINARGPILVTLFGITMLSRFLQLANAASARVVTLFGIVACKRPKQSANALNPRAVTSLPIESDSMSGAFGIWVVYHGPTSRPSIEPTMSPSHSASPLAYVYLTLVEPPPNVRTFVIKLFMYMASPHSFCPYLLKKSSLAACCISIIYCCFSSYATGVFICCSSPLLSNMTKWV